MIATLQILLAILALLCSGASVFVVLYWVIERVMGR